MFAPHAAARRAASASIATATALAACTLACGCVGFGVGRIVPAGAPSVEEEPVPVEVGAPGETLTAPAPAPANVPPHPLEGCWDLTFTDEGSASAPVTRRLELSTETGSLGGRIADYDRLGEGHPDVLRDVSATSDRIYFRTFHHDGRPADATDPAPEALREVFEGRLDASGVWRGRSQRVGEVRPSLWTGSRCPPAPPPPAVSSRAPSVTPLPQGLAAFPRPVALLGCWELALSALGRPLPDSKLRLELRAVPTGYAGSVTFVPRDGPGYTKQLVDLAVAERHFSARTITDGPMGEVELGYEGALDGETLRGKRTRAVGAIEEWVGTRCR